MAEICTLIVSPKRGNLKPSARCGKGWGSPHIHAVGQSLLVSGQIRHNLVCNVMRQMHIHHPYLPNLSYYFSLTMFMSVSKYFIHSGYQRVRRF